MEDRGKESERWGVGCGDKGGDTKIENEKGKENTNKKRRKRRRNPEFGVKIKERKGEAWKG